MTVLQSAGLVLLRSKPNWNVKGHLPLFAMATITTFYMVDSLPNAMANLIYMLCAGAVSTLATLRWPLPRPLTRPTQPQVVCPAPAFVPGTTAARRVPLS